MIEKDNMKCDLNWKSFLEPENPIQKELKINAKIHHSSSDV